ncbi:hypothetical protein CEQ90_06050 [Lewinellaceae bacterium SD302]|nr:hypothetical protein CEQ90_06050 [Lewinellaceae bacterium SD302]
MKIAIALFSLAAFWLFAFPLGMAKTNYDNYQKNGLDTKWVKEDLARYTDLVEPSGEITEKTVSLGYMERLAVASGFKVIHDSSLDQEVILSGPEDVLEHVQWSNFSVDDRRGLYFSRPIKLTHPVEMRLNLNEHHVGDFTLTFNNSRGQDNWINFETRGPLAANYLWLSGVIRTDKPVELDVNRIDISQRDGRSSENLPLALSGTAKEVNLPNQNLGSIIFDQLETESFRQYYESMSGRKLTFSNVDKLNVLYDSRDSYDVSGNVIPLIPDTFLIKNNTQLKVQVRNGEALNVFSKAVIIRQ